MISIDYDPIAKIIMDSLNQHVTDVYKYLQNLDATFLHHNKDSDSAYIGLIFSLNRINIGLNLIDHSHNVRAKSNSVILATTLIMSSLLMIYLGNVGVFLYNYAYAVAPPTNATAPIVITKIPFIQKNQTGNQTAIRNYNSTDTMISSFKSGNKLLMQAISDINTGNIEGALAKLNNAKVQIQQQQLSLFDVISGPVLSPTRQYLLAAKHSIEKGNTDKAISEFFILKQLILHQQGMTMMRLSMTRDLNSTFNSAETHLLAAGEALNAHDPRRAIPELNIATEQLYAHQLTMLNVINSLFSSIRTHFQQAINDIKINDTKEAISELNRVINSLREQEQGVLMIKGLPATADITSNRVNTTTP
ncbi:MAG: hypothetical protein WAK17_02640 [Candidatus Nitrosopolaris sp.]|jgi:hypothetical protein